MWCVSLHVCHLSIIKYEIKQDSELNCISSNLYLKLNWHFPYLIRLSCSWVKVWILLNIWTNKYNPLLIHMWSSSCQCLPPISNFLPATDTGYPFHWNVQPSCNSILPVFPLITMLFMMQPHQTVYCLTESQMNGAKCKRKILSNSLHYSWEAKGCLSKMEPMQERQGIWKTYHEGGCGASSLSLEEQAAHKYGHCLRA